MPSEISENEPRLAFDGGPLGIALFMRLIKEAPALLKSGGWLCFEVGLGQGPSMLRRLQNNPHYAGARALLDANGDVRAVAAQRR
jgi:release factor glutamine methyltransferase